MEILAELSAPVLTKTLRRPEEDIRHLGTLEALVCRLVLMPTVCDGLLSKHFKSLTKEDVGELFGLFQAA